MQDLFLINSGLYPATSLKERTQRRCFLMNFTRYLRHLFYRTPPGDCFCSIEKYCINKIVKNYEKRKKMETACKKNIDTQNKSLITIYIKSSFISFYCSKISLFSASNDILKIRVFRNNAI